MLHSHKSLQSHLEAHGSDSSHLEIAPEAPYITQGNGRPSGSEDRAFAGFIHFRGSFYEELRRNNQRR